MQSTGSSAHEAVHLAYVESRGFAQQFCRSRRHVGLVQGRSRFSLVAVAESQTNDLDEYARERQKTIDSFNALYTTRIRADAHLTLDSFKLLRQLGEGGYGSVFLALHHNTNEYVALKVVAKASLAQTNEQHTVLSERQYAFALHHPNIVQFLTSFKDNEYVYLAFEWLPGGDLYSLMSAQTLTELQAKFYAAQMLMALDCLHACRIVFRDLKPENIVLTRRGYIKLIDLGLAKIVRGYSRTFCGTPHYIAPEIIAHRPYRYSPDYWTLGIVIHEMVAGDAPYDRTYRFHESEFTDSGDDERSDSTMESDLSDVIRPSSKHYSMYLRIVHGCSVLSLDGVSSDCASLIRGLLHHNVDRRLGCGSRGALDVLEHAWFEPLRFRTLYEQKYLAPFLPTRKCLLAAEHSADAILTFSAKDHYAREFIEF